VLQKHGGGDTEVSSYFEIDGQRTHYL